jgi:sorting nexin-8
MMEQESVIANVELRNAFSLHGLHLETQLVHAHLEILAAVLGTLVAVQIRRHSEVCIFLLKQSHREIKLSYTCLENHQLDTL